MRNRIFQNIFLAAMAVFLLGLACALWTIYDHYAHKQYKALSAEVSGLAAGMNREGPGYLDTLDVGFHRITWVAADGTVLYDSRFSQPLPSHGDREEIREALETGTGHSRRHSDTLSIRTLNCALLLEDGTVLRSSTEVYSMGDLLVELFIPILTAVVAALLLALLLAVLLSRQITAPLEHIDLQNPDKRDAYPELHPLLERISGQNRQIQQKVDELKVEHARQDTMRREFTANVSHELKTPLTSISGYAELIRSGLVKTEDVPRFAGTIYNEAQRLMVLVNDIIRLSRLEDPDVLQEQQSIDLLALCQEICSYLEDAAHKRQVTLHVEGDRLSVRGVHQIVDEILYNLCDNAIKYNKPGGTVTVTVSSRDGRPVVAVQDTGIGIPPQEQERVFERFYRVDKSHSKELGGTGLGLSIVKHGAAYLGADLELESREGVGTVIRVVFPGTEV